jgi:hypothetical protein
MSDQTRHTDLEDAMTDHTAMLKEGGRLAHASWKLEGYAAIETRDGVAFSCRLTAAGREVAFVEQGGNGGATEISWTPEARADGTTARFEGEAASLFPGDAEADGTLVEALLTRQGL